eukprot:3522026-Prymnesium_polylepis.1
MELGAVDVATACLPPRLEPLGPWMAADLHPSLVTARGTQIDEETWHLAVSPDVLHRADWLADTLSVDVNSALAAVTLGHVDSHILSALTSSSMDSDTFTTAYSVLKHSHLGL